MHLSLRLGGGCALTLGLLVTTLSAQITAPALDAPGIWQADRTVCKAFDVEKATIQDLDLPQRGGREFSFQVFLGDRLVTVDLRPYDVRTPDFQLLVDDGQEIRRVPTPASVTYRGSLRHHPDSIVAASFVGGAVQARVLVTAGEVWGIQSLQEMDPRLPARSHVVYRAADLHDLGTRCGGAIELPGHTHHGKGDDHVGPLATKVAEIAIDADNPYYRLNGSNVTTTQNDVTSVINGVDAIYKRDVTITYKITTILVRTTRVYSTNNNPGSRLGEFRSRWNGVHGNIKRDVAHMFTGISRGSGVIGVAYLGVVCNLSAAYGLDWARFTGNFTARVALVAHELGHNWNARHCSGSSCNIMCAGLGGCSGILTRFAPVSINQIVSFKNTRNCLDDVANAPPNITSITPSTTTAFGPDRVTLKGTELDSVDQVTVGGVPANFQRVDATTLTLFPPSPGVIGTQDVQARNPKGLGNKVKLTIIGNHPSVIVIPPAVVRGLPARLEIHSDAQWRGLMLLSTKKTPSVLNGFVSLGIGAGFTELFTLGTFTCDNRGAVAISLTVPTTVPQFLLVHWQAVTFDPTNLTLPLEVSNVGTMSVF